MTASESVQQHRSESPDKLSVAVLTISDTRSKDDDTSGSLIKNLLESEGHSVERYAIVRDEPEQVAGQLNEWAGEKSVDAIVCNGGTGIAPRDQTFETLRALYDRELFGFGELFRMLSFEEIGAAAMLSRASAGVASGVPVFSLPGSRNAVQLGMSKLILPEVAHIVYETRKQ